MLVYTYYFFRLVAKCYGQKQSAGYLPVGDIEFDCFKTGERSWSENKSEIEIPKTGCYEISFFAQVSVQTPKNINATINLLVNEKVKESCKSAVGGEGSPFFIVPLNGHTFLELKSGDKIKLYNKYERTVFARTNSVTFLKIEYLI